MPQAWHLDSSAINLYYSDMTLTLKAREQFGGAADFLSLRIDPLAKGYPAHAHDYVEIVIVLEGSALHRIDQRAYRLAAGDVYVLRGNTVHAFEDASDDFRIANLMYLPDKVCFPQPLLQQLPGYQALFVLEPARRLEGGFKSRLRLDAFSLKNLLAGLRLMAEEYAARSPGYDSLLQARLLELVVTLSRAYEKSDGGGGRHRLLRIGEAVAWLEGHYLERLSVPELARRATLSERQFLRVFRRLYGCSPVEQILKLRIRHACGLLRSGRVSVAAAARASGFTDSNYFSKQFRRETGMPPREFLRRHAPAARP
ncbi:MAG: helix-turn-helix domain-containing protein [Lentisphaeria bacterium]